MDLKVRGLGFSLGLEVRGLGFSLGLMVLGIWHGTVFYQHVACRHHVELYEGYVDPISKVL